MSPGDRSYDAIGLMKEVSEQTAAACASAQEVLGNETPQSLLKGRRGKYENHHKDKKNHFTNSRSTLAPDILVRTSLSLSHYYYYCSAIQIAQFEPFFKSQSKNIDLKPNQVTIYWFNSVQFKPINLFSLVFQIENLKLSVWFDWPDPTISTPDFYFRLSLRIFIDENTKIHYKIRPSKTY